ncbi:MAG: hypothetical protein K6G94_10790, partial [Kiritimatiellae bacterium]|nr:hypothetical protein [Kiritimatiellia bacterium]
RMRMVNLAWELSCDRKGEWLHGGGRRANSRPVRIEACRTHFNVPFPDVGSVNGSAVKRERSGEDEM